MNDNYDADRVHFRCS